MDVSLNMEKQKKQVLSKQHEISGKQQSAGGLMAAGPQQTESKEVTARKREIRAVMRDFASRYNGEWEEKDVGASLSIRMPELHFAISDFAGLTAGEKRSGSAVELRNCLLEMQALTQDKTKEPTAEEYTEKLFELSMASEGYCDTHRGRMWTYQGSARIGIAKKVRGMTRDFLSALVTGEEEEKILSNEDADYVTGETLKSITKDLQKAAKAYKKFAARIGNDCQAYTPQEILNRRMQALRLNERKIKLYRMQYPDAAERDAGIQEMIAAYENGLRWEAVRAFTRKNEKESYLSGLIEKHVEEEGEVEHTEKLSFADQTEGLEPEQLRGIEAIDNWLIRNFQNGGLAGAAITAVK
ncbi:MAG: hypothetical protein IKO80_10965, partial [Lachnospiraceae bacterium]|nr:hypothetical protein [Lachnospiraceae bacterium]